LITKRLLNKQKNKKIKKNLFISMNNGTSPVNLNILEIKQNTVQDSPINISSTVNNFNLEKKLKEDAKIHKKTTTLPISEISKSYEKPLAEFIFGKFMEIFKKHAEKLISDFTYLHVSFYFY
jgi:hypothetical protein